MARAAKLQFHTRRLRGLTGNQLKMIACLLMLCDDIGFMLIENGVLYGQNPLYWSQALATEAGRKWYFAARILRFIGRMAFPIFAWFIAEGVIHTSDIRKYLFRLGFFALVSEVPFDLACKGVIWDPTYQNVMFTLFFGALAAGIIRSMKKFRWLGVIPAALCAAAAWYLRSDYGPLGVALIVLMYALHDFPAARLLCGAVLSAAESIGYYGISALSFLLLKVYNGSRGSFSLKYFYYLFYPLHLLLFFAMVHFGSAG